MIFLNQSVIFSFGEKLVTIYFEIPFFHTIFAKIFILKKT